MPVSPARQLARDVLLAVEAGGYAADLLHSQRARGLSLADRRLATELVMGVLRWRGQLDFVIAGAARRAIENIPLLPRTALRLGAYQLRFLDRIPVQAAVHESVEMAKADSPRAAGFVNAVLRHLPRTPMAALAAHEPDLRRRREAEFSHPAWLLERWSRNFGPSAAAAIAEYNNQPPPIAIWPPLDPPPAGITTLPGRLLSTAARVASGDVTKLEAFRQGRLWVQDEASQLIAALLAPQPFDQVLDACAAPGGKTARLAALAPTARVLALELHPRRAALLHRRLQGAASVVAADAAARLPLLGPFDRILVDAPCTGTGTLARNPEIRWRLAPTDPARLAQLQLRILRSTSAALAPTGRLVYSVCSLEPEEGPQVVEALLAADSGLQLLPAGEVLAAMRACGELLTEPSRITDGPWLRILPGAFATDGFFAAVLRRHA
ncbi:MAG TPA: transcription antitermination factor NusB [Terriglobales bacterium]|nr:transcription antitermination factor NusB [Terriglobales bacterium]